MLAAGRGLAAAHAAGLVHRDFKPHNVLRSRDGRVLVTDFGLARGCSARRRRRSTTTHVADARRSRLDVTTRARDADQHDSVLDSPLTQTGALIGTPAYMAPEQYRGAPPDPRTDQFAFCVTAWQALTGERPFKGATLDELRNAVERRRRARRGEAAARGARRARARSRSRSRRSAGRRSRSCSTRSSARRSSPRAGGGVAFAVFGSRSRPSSLFVATRARATRARDGVRRSPSERSPRRGRRRHERAREAPASTERSTRRRRVRSVPRALDRRATRRRAARTRGEAVAHAIACLEGVRDEVSRAARSCCATPTPSMLEQFDARGDAAEPRGVRDARRRSHRRSCRATSRARSKVLGVLAQLDDAARAAARRSSPARSHALETRGARRSAGRRSRGRARRRRQRVPAAPDCRERARDVRARVLERCRRRAQPRGSRRVAHRRPARGLDRTSSRSRVRPRRPTLTRSARQAGAASRARGAFTAARSAARQRSDCSLGCVALLEAKAVLDARAVESLPRRRTTMRSSCARRRASTSTRSATCGARAYALGDRGADLSRARRRARARRCAVRGAPGAAMRSSAPSCRALASSTSCARGRVRAARLRRGASPLRSARARRSRRRSTLDDHGTRRRCAPGRARHGRRVARRARRRSRAASYTDPRASTARSSQADADGTFTIHAEPGWAIIAETKGHALDAAARRHRRADARSSQPTTTVSGTAQRPATCSACDAFARLRGRRRARWIVDDARSSATATFDLARPAARRARARHRRRRRRRRSARSSRPNREATRRGRTAQAIDVIVRAKHVGDDARVWVVRGEHATGRERRAELEQRCPTSRRRTLEPIGADNTDAGRERLPSRRPARA